MAEETRENGFNFRLWRYDGEPGELIPLLQAAQDHYGYVPSHAIEQISAATGIQQAKIYGVITFYNQFRLKPMGKYVVRLCEGTACHVAGAKTLLEIIENELGIHDGETDEQGVFSIFTVACIGCCSLAPVMLVNDETYGSLDPKKVRKILRGLKRDSGAKSKQQVATGEPAS